MEQKKRLEIEFGSDKGDLIMQYLKTAYQAEENPTDVEVQGVAYKVLRREHVIAFYDADGKRVSDSYGDTDRGRTYINDRENHFGD